MSESILTRYLPWGIESRDSRFKKLQDNSFLGARNLSTNEKPEEQKLFGFYVSFLFVFIVQAF